MPVRTYSWYSFKFNICWWALKMSAVASDLPTTDFQGLKTYIFFFPWGLRSLRSLPFEGSANGWYAGLRNQGHCFFLLFWVPGWASYRKTQTQAQKTRAQPSLRVHSRPELANPFPVLSRSHELLCRWNGTFVQIAQQPIKRIASTYH